MNDELIVSGAGALFSQIEAFLFLYGRTIFTNTAGLFLGLFMTFYSCQLMWDIAHKTLIKEKYSVENFLKPVLICSFLTMALSSPFFVETWIVEIVYKFSIGLATITASLTDGLPAGSGIVGMLDLVDQRLNQVVFNPCQKIAATFGWIEMPLYVGIWIVQGLYVFVWFLFLALMLDALFRFMTFFAISPLLIPAFFFKVTKPVAMAGFRSLLHGMLSMFMAGVAMGLTIAIIGVSPDKYFAPMTGKWLFSQQYFHLILIALTSILFHLKAPKIAANLANIDDGPGAAAAVAGLGTAAVMAGKGVMLSAAGRTGSLGAQGAAKGAMGLKGFTSMSSGRDLYSRMTGK